MDIKSKVDFATQYTYDYKCIFDGETFTEESLTDTSPANYEPIDVKVARILRGEIIPTDDVYYEVDEKDSLEDAFEKIDPTEDSMFDLADVTDISNELGDKFIRNGQSDNKESQQSEGDGQGQANEGSANESKAKE